MKNKKAFTLIELLAVIVVLAIILTITIPIISNIVTSARKASFKSDARLVLDQARIQKNQNEEFDPTSIGYDNLGTYNLSNTNYESLTISMVNNKPYIYVVGKNKWAGFKACGTYNNMGVYEVTELGTCQGDGPVTFPKVIDSNPGIICSDYSTDSICYIKSVEDLVGFSLSVASGKDYTGKTVILSNGLDINSTKSYVNSTTTALGDINGDGTTTGLLTEMTTGKGFSPIGSDTKQFKGIFEGNANTIGNLYINRPTQNFVGLFGYNSGVIRGLTITEEKIYGQAYTGGIAGCNNGTISSISLQGDITASDYAGGITGYNAGSKNVVSVMINANVSSPASLIGIAVGRNEGNTSGVITGGSSVGTSNVGKAIGANFGGATFYTAASVTKSVVGSYSPADGAEFGLSILGSLSAYDSGVDTWIGGDNDSDGYYFDYDSENKIVIKAKAIAPMTFALSGTGTTNDPYLINNYDEWKQATLKVTGGYTFKLNDSINFSDKEYYSFGSNANYFDGYFKGNGQIISNIDVGAMTNAGLFGYNNGTIEDLNAVGITMNGSSYVGTITGYNNGTIKGIDIRSLTLLGQVYVGGIVGFNNGTISSVALQGDITGGTVYIGGIAGFNVNSKNIVSVVANANVSSNTSGLVGIAIGRNEGNTSGIISGGSVVGTYDIGKAIGANFGPATFYTSSSVTKSPVGGYAPVNGAEFNSSILGSINAYDAGIDTWIGGDNDSDGYYFDCDNDGNIIIKSVILSPMLFDLSGNGTTDDPYLISDVTDWKMATLKVSGGYTFKLTNNINFSNKKYYAFGSNNNYFTGRFNGNGYTISNVNIGVMTNSGLFGYNTGTIEGLNVTGINMNGISYTGIITGWNIGTIKGINISSLVITGPAYIGGIAGVNNGSITEVAVQGTVNGDTNYIGGIAGFNYSTKTISNALIDVAVSSSTAGLTAAGVGRNEGTALGVIEGVSITGTYDIGKAVGANFGVATFYTSSSVTKSPVGGYAPVNGTEFSSIYNNDLIKYNEYGLDTKYGGDNDDSSYYFDYNSDSSNIVVKSLEREPILIVESNVSFAIIDEGTSNSITNYFTFTTDSYTPVTTTCKKSNGTVITNVNQISLGKDTITCQTQSTNAYGTFTSKIASIDFSYKYLAATSTSCPSGSSMQSGSCTSSSSCATSHAIDIGYSCGGLTCATSSDVSTAKAVFKENTANPDYFLVFNATDTTGCTGAGISNYACHVEECTAYATVSEVTNYSCNKSGVTGTGASTTANLKADHYCYFREFSPPEDLISGTTFGSLTGGWRFYYTTSDSNFTSSNGYYTLYSSWDNGISTIQTTNKIDLTHYDTITLNVDMSNNNSGRVNTTYVGVYSVNETTSTLNFTKSASSTTSSGTPVNKAIVLDVSDLAGLYYIKVAVNQSPGYAYTAASKINSLKIE